MNVDVSRSSDDISGSACASRVHWFQVYTNQIELNMINSRTENEFE